MFDHINEECTCKGKRCSRCQFMLCVGVFSKNKGRGDGLNAYCLKCSHEILAEWKLAHPEREKAKHIRWRENNREKDRAKKRAWIKRNPEKVRQMFRNVQTVRSNAPGSGYTPEQWQLLKGRYNYQCLCCGKSEPEIKLTVDHVVPLSKGGSNSIDNIQPLCSVCNSQKHTKILDFRPQNP